MKKRVMWVTCLVLSAFFMVSCVVGWNECKTESSGVEMIRFSAVVDGSSIETRSLLSDSGIEDKVTEITLASYDEEGVLVDAQYYTSFSDMKLYVSKSGPNMVYALANMGDKTKEMPVSQNDVGSVSHDVESYDEVAQKGFPMCAAKEFSTTFTDREIRLERLFAKVSLRILHTSLENANSTTLYAYNLCNISSYVKQANSRLLPFAESGSRAMSQDDIMDVADHEADLNDREAARLHYSDSEIGPGPGYFQDTTIFFYVPENMQGRLLPVNEDPSAKTAGSISSVNGRDYSGLCTYIELNARKEASGTGVSGSLTYRFYLGEDNAADFNVLRNGRYDVVLDLTDEGFSIDNWKVIRGDDWRDSRDLSFRKDSYIIYPGTSTDVFVHYNRNAGTGSSSEKRASDWTYSFDEEAMAEAGVSVSFDPEQLELSPEGYNDFRFRFTASGDAEIGAGFPLTIMTNDGAVTDESFIYVSQLGEINLAWEQIPQYVAQYGVLNVEGVADGTYPLDVTVSDPSIVRWTQLDEDTFRFVAMREGTADITVRNGDGTQECSFPLVIKAPLLHITTESVALNPDGAPVMLDYSYRDDGGQRLGNFDVSAFSEYLLPYVADNPFFKTSVTDEVLSIHVDRLYDGDEVIDTGAGYELALQARDCPESGECHVRAYVTDPFDDIDVKYYGSVHDYTLLVQDGVDETLAGCFREKVAENASFRFEAPVPDADRSCVDVDILPRWTGGWSNSNGVYSITYDSDDADYISGASFSIIQTLDADILHSAGRHDIMIYVINRHSNERIGHLCGEIDVYVHTVLGMRAQFGSQSCNYKPYGSAASVPCFAEVYNEVIGREQFATESGNKIYYMDVNAEFMTDVSNVLVFSRLLSGARSGSNAFDASDIVRPGVSDGQTDANTGQLYSVDGYDGNRITVAEEDYGHRRGIGVMLYRALRLQTYDYQLAEDDLHVWFLGLTSGGKASDLYAPCFYVHDMNVSSDMELNKVNMSYPYYFSPSDYKNHVDDDGNGYHVIHYLKEVLPDTGGWINLL